MNSRFVRTMVSFAVVAAVYAVYAVAAVPLIEPKAKLRASRPSQAAPEPAPREPEKTDPDFIAWFEPGSWELDKPMVFRTPDGTGILLVRNYELQQAGKPGEPTTVKFEPCTMVLLSDDPDEVKRRRSAVILRADEATLQFSDFNGGRASIGRLAGGTIHGEVRIRSEQQSPGDEDDLFISTRDVQISERQVWTHQRVWFHYGPHNGSSRGLRIELSTEAVEGSGGTRIAGVKTIELSREVKMKLFLPQDRGGEPHAQGAGGVSGMFAGSAPNAAPAHPGGGRPAAAQATRSSTHDVVNEGIPVDVQCSGPFVFDVDALRGTFHDKVRVVGNTGEQRSDELTCEELSLYFVRDTDKPAAVAAARPVEGASPAIVDAGGTTAAQEPDGAFPKLRPARIEARGNPVTFVSPSTSIIAVGKYLEYDLEASSGMLRGEPAAELKQQGSATIQAPELRFVTSPAGELVRFAANGAGFMEREPIDGHDALVARWQSQAAYEPDGGENRLSLVGAAHVEVVPAAASQSATPGGSIAADELYVWFQKSEENKTKAPAEQGDRAIPGIGGGADPTRLLAIRDVAILLDELEGQLDRAEMWFEQTAVPAASSRAAPGTAGGGVYAGAASAPLAGPAPRQPTVRNRTRGGATNERLTVNGGTLQVEFAIGGARVVPTNVRVIGRQFAAQRTSAGAPPPGTSDDDTLVAVGSAAERGLAELVGNDFTLSGPVIEVTPPTGRALVDGAGSLSYRADVGIDGQNTGSPDWVEVDWKRRVTFDGRVAEVTGDVLARLAGGRLECQQMDLIFNAPVQLASLDGRQAEPQLDQIVCRGGVRLHQIDNDKTTGDLQSVETIRAVNLTIEQVSGDFRADGPGEAVAIGRSLVGGGPVGAGGFAALGGGRTTTAGGASLQGATGTETLDYIGLEFQYGVSGNLRRRESMFTGKVATIYGQVSSWDAHVDPDDYERLGSAAYRMECDRL
ncbi:MAG: hypothetical protein KDA63_18580, partial [Planctomycetales bacterium]|nr:hypothetical protein [Planctomycetales bacterium]